MGNCSFQASEVDEKSIVVNRKINLEESKRAQNVRVVIKTETWNKESHGLFDYESKSENLARKSFILSKPRVLMRLGNKLFLPNALSNGGSPKTKREALEETPEEIVNQCYAETLARLKYRNGSFYICPGHMVDDLNKEENAQKISEPNNMWIVTKGYKEGYPLVEGDVIKLGRMKYRIKEIRNPNIPQEHFQPKKAELEVLQQSVLLKSTLQEIAVDFEEKKEETSSSQSQKACRICYEPETDSENPLADICKCSGSMKFIHVLCLQTWFQNRVTAKTSGAITSYSWKSFNCEICTTAFPTFFSISNQQYETFPFTRPSIYIMVESFSKDNDGLKGIQVFDMAQKPVLKVGRGHESDLKVQDISVSRLHSLIKFEKQRCVIEDKSSKFGTLVLAQKGIKLELSDQAAQVQIGRTFMDCKCILRKPKTRPKCFGVKTESSEEEVIDD